MSKGDDTTKRTNFKKFSEGWDKIDWTTKKEAASIDLPQNIKDQIALIASRIEQLDKELDKENEHNSTDSGEDETR